MAVKLLTGHNLEFLSLKEGWRGSFESTPVKIPHCWKAHVAAHMGIDNTDWFMSYLQDREQLVTSNCHL